MTKSPFSLSLPNILSNVSIALVTWMLEIFLVVSLAALLFSGDLSHFTVEGTGFLLFGGFIFILVIALTSSFATAIAAPQEVPIVIMSIMAADIATQMQTAAAESLLATVVVAIIFSTTLTGIAFWLIGHFKLGQLVRFIPYPVIGGFMVGTGWALLVGGIGIMTNAPPSIALLSPAALLQWLPGMVLAICLLVLTQRYSHFLLAPLLLLAGTALFYLVFFTSTGSLTTAGTGGWLLGPFPTGGLWQPVTNLAFNEVNWAIVFGNVANFGAVILMSAIALLLNISGLEVTTQTDANLNRELKSVGVANLLAGLGGSAVGFPSLSLSLMGLRLGVRSRLVGILTSVLVGFTLLFGAGILSIIPRLIAGGLLIFLALSFFWDWLYVAWFRLSRPDYLLIWFILLTIIFVGFLEGVGIGIVVAAVLFVLDYSRIDAVHHVLTGAERRSHVVRPLLYEQLLQHRGDRIYILVLRGFLFFGSAHHLIERIRARIDSPTLPRPGYIVLDFRLVTGVDSSALFAFSRLLQLAHTQQVTVIVTHLSNKMRVVWQREFLQDGDNLTHHIFRDLDQGLAWCEEQIIATFISVGLAARSKSFIQLVEDVLRQDEQPIDWLNYLRPGTKPEEFASLAPLKQFLQRLRVEAGAAIVRQGQQVAGLYLLEDGRAIAQTEAAGDVASVLSTLEKNTVIGASELYTQEPAAMTIIADQPSTFLYLSRADMHRLEAQAPAVAIAVHRVLARILGDSLARASNLIEALQR